MGTPGTRLGNSFESSSQIMLGPNTVVPPLNSPLELEIATVVLFNKYTDLKLYTRSKNEPSLYQQTSKISISPPSYNHWHPVSCTFPI